MSSATTRVPEPRGVIDHTAYPDILRQIIEDTDHAGLLRLRATSSYYQEMADALLFKHIILDDADRPAGLLKAATVDYDALMRPTTRLLIRSPHGRLPIPPWADARGGQRMRASDLLCYAKIVDYHCDFDVESDPLLHQALCEVAIARRIFPSRTVIAAYRVIDYVDVSIHGYWTAAPLGGGSLACPTAPDVPDGVGSSVLIVLYPNRIGDWSGHFRMGKRSPNTRSTIVFVPRDTSPSRSDNASMFQLFINTARMNGPLACGVIGPIFAKLYDVFRAGDTLFVGVTDIPPRLLGLPTSIDMEAYKLAIAGATICTGMTYEPGQGWHFPPPERLREVYHQFLANALLFPTDDYEEALGFRGYPAGLQYATMPIVHGGDVARIFAPAASPGNAPPVETPSELVEQLYTVFTNEALRRVLDGIYR